MADLLHENGVGQSYLNLAVQGLERRAVNQIIFKIIVQAHYTVR